MPDVTNAESGTLFLVATPIGTLGDFSVRAGQILQRVGLILAEDTRRTRRLLMALDLKVSAPLRSLHDHNEAVMVPTVVRSLRNGLDVAVVSDAGMPVLSDPGFELVRAVRQAGLPVASVPGPSAFTTALAASGLPPLPAVLIGFLPPKRGLRRRRLAEPIMDQATTVIFLSPHRLAAELQDVAAALGDDRVATLMAELSKKYERVEMGTLGSLVAGREVQNPRGEYVLVIGPRAGEGSSSVRRSPAEAKEAYLAALAVSGERSDAMKCAARALGLGRRDFYALLLEAEDG